MVIFSAISVSSIAKLCISAFFTKFFSKKKYTIIVNETFFTNPQYGLQQTYNFPYIFTMGKCAKRRHIRSNPDLRR